MKMTEAKGVKLFIVCILCIALVAGIVLVVQFFNR